MDNKHPVSSSAHPEIDLIRARKLLKRETERLQRRLRDHPVIEGAQLLSQPAEHPMLINVWTQSHEQCTEAWVAQVIEQIADIDALTVRLLQRTRDGLLTPRQFNVTVWFSEDIAPVELTGDDERPSRKWRFFEPRDECLSA